MSNLHTFDGRSMTIDEIHARVPALSTTTIRRRLAAGCCTMQAMLAFDRKGALSAAGKKSAKRHRTWNTAPLDRRPRPAG